MGRGSDQNAIDDLKNGCKLVDVDAQYGSDGWRIRGRRRDADGAPIMDGQPVIDIKKTHLKAAKLEFEQAYGKLQQMGILKK